MQPQCRVKGHERSTSCSCGTATVLWERDRLLKTRVKYFRFFGGPPSRAVGVKGLIAAATIAEGFLGDDGPGVFFRALEEL